MAEGAVSIDIEGIQEVLRGLEDKRGEINRAASFGLCKAGMNIIADAQRNLQQNHSWVTGLLANSGRVIYGGQDFDTGALQDARQARNAATALMSASGEGMDVGLDAGFFDNSDKSGGYALYVEYGRKAGKMPPISELAQWAHTKFQVPFRQKSDKISKPISPRTKIKSASPLKPRPHVASRKAEDADTIGYLVARKIAKQGSSPHPFFTPAVERNQPAITLSILKAIKQVIQ